MYFYSGNGPEPEKKEEREKPSLVSGEGADSSVKVAEGKNGRGLKILCIVLTVIVILSNLFTLILVRNLTVNRQKSTTNEVDLLGEVIAENNMNSVAEVQVTGEAGKGAGSAFVVYSELSSCYLVTNFHVLEKAVQFDLWNKAVQVGSITVTIAGKSYSATLACCKKDQDLAVIRISTTLLKLPAVQFSGNDTLKYGQYVLAIGNPYGEGLAVSEGCVSVPLEEQYLDGISQKMQVIRTTAAINPGNSGGPLFNKDGRVIGINTARRKRQENENVEPVGMNFSIPSDTVMRYLNEKSNLLPFYINSDGFGESY